jgi:hypothetical protein
MNVAVLSLLQRRGLVWIGLACLALVAAGCGESQKQSAPREDSHIKVLARMYGRFTGRHRGQAPANEKEFRDYLEGINSDVVKRIGGVDQLLISERDHKPYVVLYGKEAQKSNGVVAYEQEGVGGKRFVADSLGVVEELDEEQFKARVPGAK